MVHKILQILKEHGEGLSLQSLARGLRLLQREKPLLRQKLLDLEDRGLVLQVKRRYFLLPQSRIIKARVVHVGRSFLFVRPEKEGGPDVFVAGRHAAGAVLGDTVELVSSEPGPEEKPAGKILRIFERSKSTVVGIYRADRGLPHIVPYDSPSDEEIVLTIPGPAPAEDGEVVEVDRETRRVVRVLGSLEDPGVDLEIVARKYDLPQAFSNEIMTEAEDVSRSGFENPGERDDLRDWDILTIDGADARDFDDAISIREEGTDRFLLGIHIADVSHFVRQGSALDREAFRRGTSVYFPERALPMLPEVLSNGACSLKPDEDRLAVSVLLDVDREGKVLTARFRPTWIRSAARLTYAEVERSFVENGSGPGDRDTPSSALSIMRDLAGKMRRNRVEAGSLDFSHPEPRLSYQEGRLVGVETFLPAEAHGLIEEFMLAANEAVASYLEERSLPFPYRVHPPPAHSDLAVLRARLAQFGIPLPPPEKVESRHLQEAQERAQLRPEGKYLSIQILRSLRLAAYSSRNSGHFGLGKSLYTHFTSPIRRYPDLMTHRALKCALVGHVLEDTPLSAAARLCSERERRAEEAERELLEWRIYRLLRSRLGDEFTGSVVDITKAGLIIELEDFYVTGLILFQDLGEEYYERDTEISLKGRRTGKTVTMGMRLDVILASIEPDERRMLLVPVTAFS